MFSPRLRAAVTIPGLALAVGTGVAGVHAWLLALDGAFLGMKHALPLMRTSNGASIVNVISLSAVAPFAPTPAYSASHAALLNLTKTTAVNCARAKEDVRVNAVVCGMSSNSPVSAIAEIAAHVGEVLWARGQQQEAEKVWRDASDRKSVV